MKDNSQVTIIDGDANDPEDLRKTIKGQDIVFVEFVDHGVGGKVEPDNSMVLLDKYIEDSDLAYTVMRLAWLNDRDDTNYTVTQKGEEYVGVSVSRKSVADVVEKIIENPATQGSDKPVY